MDFIRRLLTISLILLSSLIFFQCESTEKYYRPNLPEKICSIGIIDADDTTKYSDPFPQIFAFRSITRYISFEKSYQVEYPPERGDSLKELTFKISDGKEDLFVYENNQTIKDLSLRIPDSVKFESGKKYFLKASEKEAQDISAEMIVPDKPPNLNLLNLNKEITTLPEPESCVGTTTVKTVVIDFSFENNFQDSFYAIVLEGSGTNLSSSSFAFFGSMLIEFSIRESNTNGFSAIMQGRKMYQMACVDNYVSYIQLPVNAFFIDGSKIPENRCKISLSTQFDDGRAFFEWIKSFRIKLISIPEELYLFEKSLYTYKTTSSDPFTEPIYLNGNIRGGNGIFAICRSSELNIVLPTWY